MAYIIMAKDKKQIKMRVSRSELDLLKGMRKNNREYHRCGDSVSERYRVVVTCSEMEAILKSRGVTDSNRSANYHSDDKKLIMELKSSFSEEEIASLVELKKATSGNISLYTLDAAPVDNEGDGNVGVLLMSDWHADEVVTKESVLGKNEFNQQIAETRISNFFVNAKREIVKEKLDHLIIGSLGDLIGGWIHDELSQTNSMTPMNGVSMVKNLIISGLKYLHWSTDVPKITFIGICGNHSRTTKKMQYANGFALSYEYFMYKDIASTCKMLGLDKIEFIIPESEFAYIQIHDRNVLFCHGHQFKSAGGVGGIYPPMLRWFAKLSQTIPIDIACIGHWHTSTFTKHIVVNGNIKGYDAYAMNKGLPFEEPKQTFIVINSKRGIILHKPIFC